MLENVTIIIPAHNRPERLARLLEYYRGSGAQILVPDSSVEPFTGLTDEDTGVVYRHLPRMHFFLKLCEVMGLIDRKYVLWVADDDFAIDEGIAACAEFLDANPDYSCAQGHYLTFTPRRHDIQFTPRYIRNHDCRITDSTAQERLRRQTGMYASMLYGLTRADIFRRIYSYVFNPDGTLRFTNLFLAEEFFNHAMLISGKYATLPVFFSARERIAGSATETTVPASVIKNSEQYRPEYEGFIRALTLLLSDTSGMPATQAEELMRRLSHAPADKPSIIFKRRVNALLNSTPLLRWAARLSEWRYHSKGLRAVRHLPSYPCTTPTPARTRLESLIRKTT